MKLNLFMYTLLGLFLTAAASERMRFHKAFMMLGGLSGEIVQDQDGFLLLGSWGAGMGIYDGSSVRYLKAGPDSIPSNSVMDIYVDKKGVIWIGTLAGVCSYDKTSGKVRRFDHDPANENSIASNSIAETTNGIINHLYQRQESGLRILFDEKRLMIKRLNTRNTFSLCVLALVIIWSVVRANSFDYKFNNLNEGMTLDEIQLLIGAPKKTLKQESIYGSFDTIWIYKDIEKIHFSTNLPFFYTHENYYNIKIRESEVHEISTGQRFHSCFGRSFSPPSDD